MYLIVSHCTYVLCSEAGTASRHEREGISAPAETDPRRDRSLREFAGRNCLLVYCPPGFPSSPPTTIMNPRAMQGEEGKEEEEELLSLYCTRGGIPPGGAAAERTFVSQVNINMHERTFPPEGPIWWPQKTGSTKKV